MKRFLCVLTVLVIFMGCLPLNVLAGENADYVLQVSRMNYIGTLSGMEEDAPGWHDGMGLSTDMNGKQAVTALQTLDDSYVLPVLRLLEELVAGGIVNGISDAETEAARVGLRSIHEDIEACRSIIDYDRTYIYNQSKALKNGEYVTEHDIESVAHQIIVRTDELEEKLAYASENYNRWRAYADDIRAALQNPDDNETAMQGGNDPLRANIVRLMENYSLDMLGITSSTAAVNQPNSGDIIVDVVDVNHVRVYARDTGKKILPNATIRVWSLDGKREYTQKPNEKGYAEFSLLDLNGDADHYVEFGWEVSAEGYRTQYSEMGLYKGGSIVYANLDNNDPSEDTYVAGVSFNGRDCMYDATTLYITPKNDAQQTITAHLRTQSGGAAVGMLTMKSIDKDGNEISVSMSCDNQSSVSFTDLWCSRLAPDQGKAVELVYTNAAANNGGSKTYAPIIATTEATYEEPQFFPDAISQLIIFSEGLRIDLPKDIPVLDKMRLDIDLPLPKFRAYVDFSGQWLVGYTPGDLQFWDKLQKRTEMWKTADTKQLEKVVNQLAEDSGDSVSEIEKNLKKDLNESRTNTFFGGTKAYWSFCFMACGTAKKYNEDLNQFAFTFMGGVTVGFKGEWSKTLFAGPFPFTFTFGFDFSVGTTLRLDQVFLFDCLINPIEMQYWADVRWRFHFSAMLYGSVGVGFKCFGAGLKLISRFSGNIPIAETKNSGKSDTDLNFTIMLSVYFKLLFVTATYNLYSGSIDYANGSWGSWQNKPFWKSSLYPSAVGTLSSALNGEKEPEETNQQDDLNGDTPWSYSAISGGVAEEMPTFCTVGNTVADHKIEIANFAFFVKDQKTVCYSNLDWNYTGSVPLPAEATDKINEGKWIITDIGVSCSPLVQELDIYTPVSSYKDRRQVGAVSVTCATSWTVEQKKLDDGTTVETICPTESIIYTKMFTSSWSNLEWLEAYSDRQKTLSDLTYVVKSHDPLSHVFPLIYNQRLTTANPRGYLEWQVFADGDAEGTHLVLVGYDDKDKRYVQMLDTRLDDEGYAEYRPCGDAVGEPVRILKAAGEEFEIAFILTDEGELFSVSGERGHVSDLTRAAEGISDIALLSTSDPNEGGSSEMVMFLSVQDKTGEEETPAPHRLMTLTLEEDGGYAYTDKLSDLDVTCSAKIDAGIVLNESTVYWFETYADPSDPDTALTRVTGMIYAPDKNLITAPYTLGVLTGNDGTPPDGYAYTAEPVRSKVINNGNILMVKPWLRGTEVATTAEASGCYEYYMIKPVARISPDIMAVAAQEPACSAGGSCMLDLQVINRGNVPILGFNADVYVEESGGRKLVESVRIDLINAERSTVLYMPEGNANGMTASTGVSSARRVPGLFDRINGDEWLVTRKDASMMVSNEEDAVGHIRLSAGNGDKTEFVSVPVLIPEAVQIYTMSFHVPADWGGEKHLTIEISQALVPEKTSDIFRMADAINGLAAADSLVYLVSVDPYANEEEGCKVEVAGTLSDFDFEAEKTVLTAASAAGLRFAPGSENLFFDTAELKIDYRMFRSNGEAYITFTFSQTGSTDNAQPRGVQIRAYTDNNESPSFVHTYRTHPTNSKLAYSATIPVIKLTGGRGAGSLTLEVLDTVNDNSELTTVNNRHTFYLNDKLRITQQPEDVNVEVAQSARLSVEAAGGTEPYTYQWQELKNGVWTDVSGADNAILYFDRVTKADNRKTCRCVITDKKGNYVVSDAAVITVIDIPVTGDSFFMLIPALLILSLVGFAVLSFEKRKHRV